MASGVTAKIGTVALGSQAELTTPCSKLFRERLSGGRLGGQMGYSVACLSPRQAGSGGLLQGGGVWMALALGQCLPSRPGVKGDPQSPELVGSCQVCGFDRDCTGGGEASHLTHLYQWFLGACRGPSGGLLVGSWRTDSCCVAKLWHLIPACREGHEKDVGFYLAY